jgi:hypothetical protein
MGKMVIQGAIQLKSDAIELNTAKRKAIDSVFRTQSANGWLDRVNTGVIQDPVAHLVLL